MKVTGTDGKEYTIEPETNLSGLFGMVRLSFQKDLRFLKEWDLDC